MYLGTDHSASSYGAPVLISEDRTAYGPADRLPSGQTAADWARQNLKDDPQLKRDEMRVFTEKRHDISKQVVGAVERNEAFGVFRGLKDLTGILDSDGVVNG